MPLDINKEITFLRQQPDTGSYHAAALERLQQAINNIAAQLGVDPVGQLPAPAKVQQLNIKTDGNGTVHATIDDNNPINRNLHYFVEYSTDRAFSRPHVLHIGASRSAPPITLPAKDDGGQPQVFYFRAYSQHPGSMPGEPVYFGGDTPTAVAPGGTTQMTLLPSTGSGTAQNNGQQGNWGFGRTQFRPASSVPKRTSAAI